IPDKVKILLNKNEPIYLLASPEYMPLMFKIADQLGLKHHDHSAISAVDIERILTSKAQHEGRVRALVKIRSISTAEIADDHCATLTSDRQRVTNEALWLCSAG
ncbi:MAG: hypothetical protein JO149_01760, partial [Gammaproteobacteria bacterium]|nr:hypothetical protein [Gammaproteobacteria bacterium]